MKKLFTLLLLGVLVNKLHSAGDSVLIVSAHGIHQQTECFFSDIEHNPERVFEALKPFSPNAKVLRSSHGVHYNIKETAKESTVQALRQELKEALGLKSE